MKKFNFRLQKVLNYKNQILDSLKNEHAEILMQIFKQEKVIEDLEKAYSEMCSKYNSEKAQSVMKLENVRQYENYILKLDNMIKSEKKVLKELQLKEEKKRAEVVKAKQDTESIEKLKERKYEEYNKELRVEQDLIVEEFITNKISRYGL